MFSNLYVQNCLKYSPIFLLMSAGNCFIHDSGNFYFQFFFVSFVKHLLILLIFPPKNPSALCFIHILVDFLISISLISAYLYFFLSLFALFSFMFSRWKFRLLISDLSFILIYAFATIDFLLCFFTIINNFHFHSL